MPYRGCKSGSGFGYLFFLVFLISLVKTPGATRFSDDIQEKTANFISSLHQGNYDTVYAAFDPVVQSKIDRKGLEKVWKSLVDRAGPFIKIERMDSHQKESYRIIVASCRFEKTQIGLQFTYDADGKIAGFFIVPAFSAQTFQRAAYVDENKFISEDVSFGSKPWVLPGVLTIPLKGRPAAVLILVHGSGPQDRDETIGPNKPFRDLGEGLAARGIAVLRYDKRTKVYAQEMAAIKDDLTVQDEIIDDVLAAINFLKQRNEIDQKRLFLLGHSLGGTVMPRIALQDSICAGFIIMAGATRPLEDLILEQVSYIAGLDNILSDEEKNEIEKIKAQVRQVKDRNLDKRTPAALLPFGMSAAYWLDLRRYDPAAEAAKIQRPILVLQGERDYQVTAEDLLGWRSALASSNDAEIITFPDLNHLFMTGKGKSRPGEYMQRGHVAAEVIETIVNWIDSY